MTAQITADMSAAPEIALLASAASFPAIKPAGNELAAASNAISGAADMSAINCAVNGKSFASSRRAALTRGAPVATTVS